MGTNSRARSTKKRIETGNYDAKIPAELTLLGASMPVKDPGVGQIKAGAQGILIGNVIQSVMKNKGLSGSGSNFGLESKIH
ncbi:hypothetical protein MSSIH_3463 [Methanosarcina siciliae HI350]|uniref:Uncharacterized protein n=1 Tax=Methanosarcina siciliae HI350 TaxID=1434119 RepID=A0A0E3PIU6_9EURY|nr:hypothetical protein MSSIH_3463 [Methanosarcina siciliae HI350]